MQKRTDWGKRLTSAFLLIMLAAVLPYGAGGRAEAKAVDVLLGAFGEAIDTLEEPESSLCIAYADRALEGLLEDFMLEAAQAQYDAYLQILQTTLLLPESLPDGATDAERAVWDALYADAACVVSFVVIDSSLNAGDVSYAEITGRFGDYAIRQDGSVENVSLRNIRSRYFTSPIVLGVRVINMGSHYNAHYTYPALSTLQSAIPLENDAVSSVRIGQIVYCTLTENQTTPYRWAWELSDDTVLECIYDTYISDSNPKGMTGVGGNHWYYFRVVGMGACTIDMSLTHIGDDGEEPVESYHFEIIVDE